MGKVSVRMMMVSLLIFFAFCVLFTGCGRGNSQTNEDTKSNTVNTQQNSSANTAALKPENKEKVTLTIATVNNTDMFIMQKLTSQFTEKTGIDLKYVILPENELRQKVTEDVRIGAGKYDIVTIGTYDTPFWGQNKWVESLETYFDNLDSEERKQYDREDLLRPIRSALSFKGAQFALPFYGESSILYYRKDLFDAAGLKMPDRPTWNQVYEFAKKLHNPSNGVYGIILRGQPGWGMNMAVFGSMINTFGAKWYDMNWKPQFNTAEMKNCWEFYKKIISEAGEPDAHVQGFPECMKLFSEGKGAMWYDATAQAGTLMGKDSQVVGKVGYALAPTERKDNAGWLWAWSLAIESSSKNKDAAFKFITWATSKEYIELVGNTIGWAQVPPATRESTYANPKYLNAAPFAKMTYESIKNVNYERPTIDPVPYVGIQYVSIPEFQNLGELVSQQLAAYLAGKKGVNEALKISQLAADKAAKEGGYQK